MPPRDTSNWPPVLRLALEAGIAPTLDILAEKVRAVFWREVSKEMNWLGGEKRLVIQDLRDAAIEVLEHTDEDTIFTAFRELWHLNEYALPYPASFDTVFGNILLGAFVPHDMMIDLLYSAMETRARLDESVEKEELQRKAMQQLARKEYDPQVDALAAELVGRSGDHVEYMTFDELVERTGGLCSVVEGVTSEQLAAACRGVLSEEECANLAEMPMVQALGRAFTLLPWVGDEYGPQEYLRGKGILD